MVSTTNSNQINATESLTRALVSTQKGLLMAADNLSKIAVSIGASPAQTEPTYVINRARGLRAAKTRALNRERARLKMEKPKGPGRGNHVGKLTEEDKANLRVLLEQTTIPVSKIQTLVGGDKGISRAAVYQFRDRENINARFRPFAHRRPHAAPNRIEQHESAPQEPVVTSHQEPALAAQG